MSTIVGELHNGTSLSRGSDFEHNGSKILFVGERGFVNDGHVGIRIVDEREEKNLSRSLGQRHIQMIALAGAIVRPASTV